MWRGGRARGSSGGIPMTAERMLSAMRMLVSSTAASGSTSAPTTPRPVPRTNPGKPPSSAPLPPTQNALNEVPHSLVSYCPPRSKSSRVLMLGSNVGCLSTAYIYIYSFRHNHSFMGVS